MTEAIFQTLTARLVSSESMYKSMPVSMSFVRETHKYLVSKFSIIKHAVVSMINRELWAYRGMAA